MNSQAHVALTKIQGGKFAHQTLGGVEPIGYNFEDGSSLVKDAVIGWKIGACVMECSCVAGLEAYGSAVEEFRHRTGLVSFGSV